MSFVRDRASVSAAAAVVAASLFSFAAPAAQAATFVPTTGTHAWNVDTNWSSPATFPNANGAVADFGPRTGTTTANLSQAITVGSISNLNNGNFTLTIANGTGGSLALNNGGAGATITDDGSSTSLWTISATTALADNLTVHTVNANSASAAGEITFTGTVSGTGFGVTKTGPGLVTFGTNSKTYTGATTVTGGRLRVSNSGRPTATSGISVGTGAQLFLLDATSYAFGASSATPITINGIGTIPSSSTGGTQLGGSFGAAGAIRQGTAGTTTVTNDIVVGSNDGSVSAGNTNTNVLVLSGVVSGNRLRVNPFGNAPDQGTVRVTNTNTYSGGTLISQGILQVSGANATLGTGDVYVDGASNDLIGDGTPASTAGLASGRLVIDAGVLNAIADSATLTLTGDTATFGGPDGTVGGIATLGTGIDELVGALILGGVPQASDFDGVTFGSSASGADVRNDAYFSTLGTGVVRLAAVPEPTSLALLGLGGLGLLRRRRA